jgi:hypothetical protein
MQVFDSASRGPLGSLFLILQHKGQTLVLLGVTITVLSLIFDLFMQQVLTYPIRERLVNGTSGGATTNRALIAPLELLGEDAHRIVYTGQFSDSLDLTPTCPSGNCTWEPFRSVGICSACEDIHPLPRSAVPQEASTYPLAPTRRCKSVTLRSTIRITQNPGHSTSTLPCLPYPPRISAS